VLVLAAGRGTRLPTSGGWSKHLEPLPGRSERIIDAVVHRLRDADDILVAAGHEADALTAHLAACCPEIRCFRVDDMDDLPASIAAGLSRLDADRAVVVEGDVLIPARSMAAFLTDPREPPSDLDLLVGGKDPRPDRCTIDLSPAGVALAVRPVAPGDLLRWSVLAAACRRDVQSRVASLCAPYSPLAGLGVSMWHVVAARLLAEGAEVRVTIAADGGVNINSPCDLAAAGEYVRLDARAGHG
jgi:hypothetical protein